MEFSMHLSIVGNCRQNGRKTAPCLLSRVCSRWSPTSSTRTVRVTPDVCCLCPIFSRSLRRMSMPACRRRTTSSGIRLSSVRSWSGVTCAVRQETGRVRFSPRRDITTPITRRISLRLGITGASICAPRSICAWPASTPIVQGPQDWELMIRTLAGSP